MTIKLIYLSVVIPITNINKCSEVGGLIGALERGNKKGQRLHDDFLYKESAMAPEDVGLLVDFWEKQGLILTETVDGVLYWKDLCVVDMYSGPTLPCKWLEYDPATRTAQFRINKANNTILTKRPVIKKIKFKYVILVIVLSCLAKLGIIKESKKGTLLKE